MLLNRLVAFVRDHCQLTLDEPLVVGLSGGADSLCLLDGLRHLGYRVIGAHFDHQIRPESGREAEQVAAVCRSLGVRFVGGQGAVTRLADEKGQSLEEAARAARYQFLFACARAEGAQGVAVGHTADDQVETVLLHLIRGSGPAGLKGMSPRSFNLAWDAALPLVRPLLGFRHDETLAYCQEQSLQPMQDPSNSDTTYLRNRVRAELIPALETYNPRFRQAMLRLAGLMEAEDRLVEFLAQEAWKGCFLVKGEGFVALRRPEYTPLPLALRRRVLRRAAGLIQSDLRELDQGAVDLGLAFLEHPAHSFPVDLAGGLCLRVEAETIYLARWDAGLPSGTWPQMEARSSSGLVLRSGAPADVRQTLGVPGRVELSNGWRLEACLVADLAETWQKAPGNPNPYQAWLDADKLSLPLEVRTRQPGDRFQPLGMEGHSQKLSDFFGNARLPARARSSWPLVCSGGQVIWVAGFRLAESVRLDQQTRSAILLRCYIEKGWINSHPPAGAASG